MVHKVSNSNIHDNLYGVHELYLYLQLWTDYRLWSRAMSRSAFGTIMCEISVVYVVANLWIVWVNRHLSIVDISGPGEKFNTTATDDLGTC